MNGDNFHEWFKSIIQRLDPNSVIVMDNASYHSVRSEKIPISKKDEILMWLTWKGILIDWPMIKAQLLVKVREVQSKYICRISSIIWPKMLATQYFGYYPTVASSAQLI